jgi:hypothetical protein
MHKKGKWLPPKHKHKCHTGRNKKYVIWYFECKESLMNIYKYPKFDAYKKKYTRLLTMIFERYVLPDL